MVEFSSNSGRRKLSPGFTGFLAGSSCCPCPQCGEGHTKSVLLPPVPEEGCAASPCLSGWGFPRALRRVQARKEGLQSALGGRGAHCSWAAAQGLLWALLAACISQAYLSTLLSLKHDISLCHHCLKYSCVKEVIWSTCEFSVCFRAHCGLV